MQRIGRRLRAHRYLVGDEITEADVLFHPFLTRFRGTCCADHAADPAPLAAFPEIAAYAQDLSRQPSFQDAADV
jgi:glutathionyl-hydroquinone reductase